MQAPHTQPVGNYTIPALENQEHQNWSTEAIVALVGLFVTIVPILAFVWKKIEPYRVALGNRSRQKMLSRSNGEGAAELGEIRPLERPPTLNRAMTF